ncbi:hypothetical protein BT96DRAFT_824985, partial [Gymnopus androsaceus JB14]
LHSHAVNHYKRVLQLAEKEEYETGQSNAGHAKEAAYNLSLIYILTGATPLAEMLYRRWLSL